MIFSLLLSLIVTVIGAEKNAKQPTFAVSLLQETQDILCQAPGIDSLVLDKRDKFLHLTLKGEKHEYASVDFYDDAVLMKHKTSDQHLLFHTQQNGQVHLILGLIHDFKEGDCEDTGSSKTCQVAGQTLFWSPTELNYQGESKIIRYGFFPNDATYHLARSKTKARMVIDFGAKVKLLVGTLYELNCRY